MPSPAFLPSPYAHAGEDPTSSDGSDEVRSAEAGQEHHIEVDDLSSAVEHALASGAALADFQPQAEVRALCDPAGHPFRLFVRSGPGG
ncbi:VOC family protein [Streptomyces sp. NPDC012403]|uniref:VOC family protein n=1 Tax=Streptomyces sp. NPDC012403 TaxID=3364831 RepID=UPI0036EDB03C